MTSPPPPQKSWAQLFPAGRTIFYEGRRPLEFADTITREFGFDPRADPLFTAEHHWGFLCPSEHLDAIYASNRWALGS